MSMRRGYLCALTLCLASFTGVLQAREHHYEDLYAWAQGVQWVNARPDRRYVEAFIQVRSRKADVPVGTIRLSIHASGGDIVVPLSSSGVLDLPINGALVEENPLIEFSGKAAVSVTVRVSAPARQSFDYALVRDMVAEYYKTVNQQNFLPDQFKSTHVRGLALRGAEDGLQVQSGCGLKVERHKEAVVIDYDEHAPADCKVTLSRQPAAMELVFKWF